ncbi:MAG: hypothetical protein GTN49_01970 [candidate division Zixibacteria bacterium]|nr:hypothetical protein [candidate division Zixibacteria bacterium]
MVTTKRLSIALVLTVAAATVALGHSQYVSRIPNGSVFRCDTCHTEHKSQQDFKNNGLK